MAPVHGSLPESGYGTGHHLAASFPGYSSGFLTFLDWTHIRRQRSRLIAVWRVFSGRRS
jgi:hypothetical protein